MAEDPYETFKLQILAHLLFEGPNSLFFQNIIEEGHAPNYCPGYGYDYTTRQSTFTIGVQGINEKDQFKVEKKLKESLLEASEKGFDKNLFETVLHQLEFAAKKTKDHVGLGYISHMVPFFLHGGDPLSFFMIDEYSKRIREEFNKGGLFEGLIKKYLLDNEHKLRLISSPDPELDAREESREKRKLEMLSKALSK